MDELDRDFAFMVSLLGEEKKTDSKKLKEILDLNQKIVSKIKIFLRDGSEEEKREAVVFFVRLLEFFVQLSESSAKSSAYSQEELESMNEEERKFFQKAEESIKAMERQLVQFLKS